MAKAEKFYRVEFRVMGHGTFPFDMLRYDQCCPLEDANGMSEPARDQRHVPREIRLVRYTQNKGSGPTEGRWHSFGWAVVRDSVRFL